LKALTFGLFERSRREKNFLLPNTGFTLTVLLPMPRAAASGLLNHESFDAQGQTFRGFEYALFLVLCTPAWATQAVFTVARGNLVCASVQRCSISLRCDALQLIDFALDLLP
jgi:hypothetical protein